MSTLEQERDDWRTRAWLAQKENDWLLSVLPDKMRNLVTQARKLRHFVAILAKRSCQTECSGRCIYCDAEQILKEIDP